MEDVSVPQIQKYQPILLILQLSRNLPLGRLQPHYCMWLNYSVIKRTGAVPQVGASSGIRIIIWCLLQAPGVAAFHKLKYTESFGT